MEWLKIQKLEYLEKGTFLGNKKLLNVLEAVIKKGVSENYCRDFKRP